MLKENLWVRLTMMTSSNGNIFRVTGPLCGKFTGPGEFPTKRPVTRRFDVFFDLRLNKQLNKQSWIWWFETLSRSLWRHRNEQLVYEGTCDKPLLEPMMNHFIYTCYRLSIYRGCIWNDSVHCTTIIMIKLRSDLHSRTTPHTSPLRARYRVSLEGCTKKNGLDLFIYIYEPPMCYGWYDDGCVISGDTDGSCTLTAAFYLVVWHITILWWRHIMETFSALLALYAGNLPVSAEFPARTKASDAELWCFLWSVPE